MSGTDALTERDIEVLNELQYFCDSEPDRGARPLDLGAGSKSHHSATLAKLARKGFVLKKNWAVRSDGQRDGVRGSCRYWITESGRAALAKARATS